jgi:hypothetical protein
LTRARAAAALMLIGGTFTAGPAAAQDPSLTIRPLPDSAYRPIVRVERVLADDALEEAARSGLPLRVRIRVELWKDGWIDHLAAQDAHSAVVVFEPLAAEYLVRSNPGPSAALRFPTYAAARRAVEREFIPPIRPRAPGRYYYTATLELETLSLSDLEELERWLQGELQPAVTGDRSIPGAVGQGAKRLMIRLLGLPARRLEARSGKFEVPRRNQ